MKKVATGSRIGPKNTDGFIQGLFNVNLAPKIQRLYNIMIKLKKRNKVKKTKTITIKTRTAQSSYS